ncbi:copper chaperone PCu(A)C [Streptomyces malaysiensis]|uniref:Copper chaperone PCu(A)C n=1 Tax=Streptomyces malaysiensis subsp. samsunensis TaxID=459658 RepID=A0A9X2LS41_STRMQ|nr:copper chaperone PCu(A)C [Streptomyces samsunensis]MCQ8828916.1 copper chaperone PCu(A)C [Streptomyces samsunensis]
MIPRPAGGVRIAALGSDRTHWWALRAAAVPVLACLLTLGTLLAWTAAGGAGAPAALSVRDGRVFAPTNPEATAAFFTIVNRGDSDDQLTGVTAPGGQRAMLSRSVPTGKGARHMKMISAVTVPAGGALRMTADAVDVMLKPPPRIAPGDRLTLVLHFRDSPSITTRALAVRPGR